MSDLSKYLRHRVKCLKRDGDILLKLFPQEAENIASELEQLTDENAKLRARVAELEAKILKIKSLSKRDGWDIDISNEMNSAWLSAGEVYSILEPTNETEVNDG